MAGEPADERTHEHEPDDEHEPGGEPAPSGEAELQRIGPIAIARHVKDDGRALILYSEAPHDQQERRPA
jgi:hypothetical protein